MFGLYFGDNADRQPGWSSWRWDLPEKAKDILRVQLEIRILSTEVT
jgi:hypothetical protein